MLRGYSVTSDEQPSSHELGQKLLLVAGLHDWTGVRALLQKGADPSVTSFSNPQEFFNVLKTFPEPERRRIAASWEDFNGQPVLRGESAIGQAVEQGNIGAVKLLIRYHAKPDEALLIAIEKDNIGLVHSLLAAGGDWRARNTGSPCALDLARYSGDRDMINLLEDNAHVPPHDRSLAQEPFAPSARSAKYEVIPGTADTIPTRHLLWISSHGLLILRNSPRRFLLVNLNTGSTRDLPELSKNWDAQEEFDPDMLTASPDGKWLLGVGGTKDHPTWLATEIFGNSFQEWGRVRVTDSNIVVQLRPIIAWIDGERWVELNEDSGSLVARTRARGTDAVQQVPLQSSLGYLDDFPPQLFAFHTPTEGLIDGEVACTAVARVEDNYFVIYLSSVTPGAAQWRINTRTVRWSEAQHAGSVERCVLSPDGRHLAWMTYFTKSEAIDILLTDANGNNPRIVYENLYANRDWKSGRDHVPWYRSLEWTRRGDGLIFWIGENGTNGLGLLRLSSKELQ